MENRTGYRFIKYDPGLENFVYRKRVMSQNREWFRNAGLGMFIHWGMYSVHGRGEWCPYQEQIPMPEYDARYLDQFTADEYDPELWARYALRAGMEYMVLTVKHHDGFCLFDTKTTDRNAVRRGPKRDLIAPFVAACRKYGLKCGLYFSLPDWSIPAFFSGPKNSPAEWEVFLERIVFPQVRELCTGYGKFDILWYDNITNMSNGSHCIGKVNVNFRENTASDAHLTAEDYHSAELNAMVRSLQPDILINDRSLLPEDFYTAEQNLRAPAEPDRLWEACLTMNKHWGFYPADPYYKMPFEIFHAMTAVASSGGHLLLNVGPDRYGRINRDETAILEAVGNWMKVNGESVKGTSHIALSGGSYGCASQKGNTVYLYLHYANPEGFITVPDCSEKFRAAVLLGSGEPLRIEYRGGNMILHGTPVPEYGQLPVIRLKRV